MAPGIRKFCFVTLVSVVTAAQAGEARGKDAIEKLAAPVSVVAKRAVTPRVAVDAEGGVYVVFFDTAKKDFMLTVSKDGGKSFAQPTAAIATGGRGAAGMQRGPQVGVGPRGLVYVSACLRREEPDEKSPGGDVYIAASRDGGKSFGEAVRVNDVLHSAPEGYNVLAVSPAGEAQLAWLDLRRAPELMQMVYSAKISLNAAGEPVCGKNVEVYVSPNRTVCECCNIGIALDGRGNPAIAFRNSLADGSRDAFLTVSRDGGASFSPAVKVGRGTWKTG